MQPLLGWVGGVQLCITAYGGGKIQLALGWVDMGTGMYNHARGRARCNQLWGGLIGEQAYTMVLEGGEMWLLLGWGGVVGNDHV